MIDFSLYVSWWKSWKTLPVRPWLHGAVEYKAGRYKTAIPYYERGLQSHPHHPASFSARLDLAYCHQKLGQF